MLDINLFREYKGGNPEIVRESQRRRYADVSLVDKVIELDEAWRKSSNDINEAKKVINLISKEVANKMKNKKSGDINVNINVNISVDNNVNIDVNNIVGTDLSLLTVDTLKTIPIDQLKKTVGGYNKKSYQKSRNKSTGT